MIGQLFSLTWKDRTKVIWDSITFYIQLAQYDSIFGIYFLEHIIDFRKISPVSHNSSNIKKIKNYWATQILHVLQSRSDPAGFKTESPFSRNVHCDTNLGNPLNERCLSAQNLAWSCIHFQSSCMIVSFFCITNVISHHLMLF